MIINKYLAGLLTLAIAVLTGAVAIPEAAWSDPATVWQFAGLVVAAIVTTFLPLSKGSWAAALKVLGSLVATVVANVVGYLASGGAWGFTQWLLLGLAVLMALAAELGVNVRIDATKTALADGNVPDAAVVAADAPAVVVIQESTAAPGTVG